MFLSTGNVLTGNSTPYCNQNNMMSSHHNFCQVQSGSDQIGSGDGKETLKAWLQK